ncbi:transposase [Teichococcus vastitatis]|uniref:transposase n=1 Tax=Teichococcus vastitatis TaxID=2307076 RepID=UPI000E708169
MDIINGVERRRRWRMKDKLRILAEIDAGAWLAAVARWHDVSRGRIWQWRDAQRRGRLVVEMPSFVPVHVVSALPGPRPWHGLEEHPAQVRSRRVSAPSRSCCRTVPACAWPRAPERRPCASAVGVARVIPVPSGVRVLARSGAHGYAPRHERSGLTDAGGAWA